MLTNQRPPQPWGGSFIPLAPDQYLYSDEPGYRLSDQRATFQQIDSRLTYAVDETDSDIANALAAGTVPTEWKRKSGTWNNLIAPYCMGCHFGMTSPALRFRRSEDFAAFAPGIRQDICVAHTMPNASPAFEQFWRTSLLAMMLDDPNVLPAPVAGSGDHKCFP